MARKAPRKGQAKRKRKSAPPPSQKRKAPSGRAAAPPRKRPALTAYQKRLLDYQRAHPDWRHDPKWKQKARGHKEAEHIVRAQRLRDRVEAFAMQQAMRFPGDATKTARDIAQALWQQIKIHGEGRLREVQAFVRRLERERAEQPKDERGRPRNIPWVNMEDFADEWELPSETFGYH